MTCPPEAPRTLTIALENGSTLEVCCSTEGTLLKYDNRDKALRPTNCWLDLPAMLKLLEHIASELARRDESGHFTQLAMNRVAYWLQHGERTNPPEVTR